MPKQTHRYRITVRKGRKIVEEHLHDDYDQAMSLLDTLTENLSPTHSIEFKDASPFGTYGYGYFKYVSRRPGHA
jgi:hypothetical protein